MATAAHNKHRRRLQSLESELALLESLPPVQVTEQYRDKAGRRRKRQVKLPHSIRQSRRIELLKSKLIPKAKRNY